MSAKIWGYDPNLGDFEFTTCGMMKENAKQIKPEYLSDSEKNKTLIAWFLEQSRAVEYPAQRQKLLDSLFRGGFGSMDEASAWLSGLYERFDYLELSNDEYYLMDTGGNPRNGRAFAEKAAALVQSLPESMRGTALARITVSCMILSILPDELPQNLKKALLAPWQDGGAAYSLQNDEAFSFGWQNLPEGRPLTLRTLGNPGQHPIRIHLLEDGGQGHTLRVPAGGRLTACFAGKRMTCVRGAIRVNGDRAAGLCGGALYSVRISAGEVFKQPFDPDGLRDYDVHSSGRLHRLSGTTLTAWDGDGGTRTLENAVAVFSLDSIWVALMSDGTTRSNRPDMEAEDICAAAKNGETILLLSRGGEVLSLDGRSYTPKDVSDCMLGRFTGTPDRIVEQVAWNGKTIQITDSDELQCK